MTTTGVYEPGVESLVATTHAQDVVAKLDHPTEGVHDLHLLAGSLRFDATQVPRVSCDLSVRTVDRQTELDLFDPRTGARLLIDAGYIFPSGRYDSHPVADLLFTYRNSTRPADTLELRATSSEQRVIERGVDAALSGSAGVLTSTAITNLIMDRYPAAAVTVHDTGPNVAAAWTIQPGSLPWQTIEDLADAAGLEAFDDGLGVIHIQDQPRLVDPADWRLFIGEAGTVETSRSDINRDQFANGIALVHTFDVAGTETVVTGRAFASAGVFAWGGPAGRCLYTENRSTQTTQAAADAAAAQILYRRLGAGRGVSVDAVAAWWLRPGMTVDVLLPLGAAMRQLVTTVTFDLTAGRMTVTTREPDDVTTTTSPPGG